MMFRWRDGKLEASFPTDPDWEPPGGVRAGDGRPLAHRLGPEHGEALRIVRGDDGAVERLVWAGYPVTREPGPWRAPQS